MKPIHLIIAIAVACMWGFNFSIIKLGLTDIDPFILTGLRFTFAAIPAVFFIPKPNVSLSILALYGLTFGIGVWGMLTLSIHIGVSAGMASLLLQSSAFISVIFAVLFLKEQLNILRITGLLFSILGLMLIMTIQDGSVSFSGIFLALVSAFCLSCVSLIIKKAHIIDMFSFVVWSCLFAPIPLFILSYVINGYTGFERSINHINALTIFSVFFQAYPVTLLGYWTWNKLLKIYPMSTMAPLTLLVPVFGFLGSILFYDEQIGSTKLIACSFILLGIILGLLEPFILKNKQLKLKSI